MYKKKKILAVVLARAGSKGIKNKNLKKINGISLVGRVGLFIKKIKCIDFSIVSTNSTNIGKEASKYKLGYLFKRPASLSGSTISDELVLKHALIEIEKKVKVKFDIILSLPPTSPLRKTNDVIKSVKKLVDENYEAVWTISKKGEKIKYRQQLDNTYYRNGSVYVLTRNTLMNKKILTKNSGYVISNTKQISIDSLEDLKKVREYLKK